MSFPLSKASILLTVSSALWLSACGGGGGGSSAATPSTSQTASTITAANSADVAAQAYAASNALNNQINNSTDFVTGVSVETKTTGILDSSMHHLYRALQTKPSHLVIGVSGTESAACTGGGTLTITYNVADPDTLSNGDTVSITSNNCVENQVKTNGSVSFTFNNMTGMPSPMATWSATMALSYKNFSATQNNVTDTVNGDLVIQFSQTASGLSSFAASGSSLQLSTSNGSSTINRNLSGYSYSGSATSSNLYTYRSNFAVAGDLPRLGNNVAYTVKTTTDFKQQGVNYPYQGQLVVTANDNTSVTVTVLDATNVQLGIDANGDGKVDTTATKTWAELASLL